MRSDYRSAYLLSSMPTNRKTGVRFYRRLILFWHRCPRLPIQVWLGLSLWLVLISTVSLAIRQQASLQISSLSPELLTNTNRSPASGRLAIATSQQELPHGPSGQALPPGTLAAPGTYSNPYKKGQCTWYVAGRRPIPNNWGHARTWYERAQAAKWQTGSIPAIGAIAWTPQGWYGHVALVQAVDGNRIKLIEMNYLGPYKISERWESAASFKYIY